MLARARELFNQHRCTYVKALPRLNTKMLPRRFLISTSMLPPDTERRHNERSEAQVLSPIELHAALDAAIKSHGSAEVAILHLIRRFSFSLDALKGHLQDRGLDVSFSRVSFSAIAPLVGLNPALALWDAPSFQVSRARIPTSLFKEIIKDMELMMKQFGPPIDHVNEESKSRFLAPIFNHLVGLFNMRVINTPESIIPGRLTTQGRIEYKFQVFGGTTFLFIQAEVKLGTAMERLSAIAQVVAECNACDYANVRAGFASAPIYGVLAYGNSFEFFRFDGRTEPPTFSRGMVSHLETSADHPQYSLVLPNLISTSSTNFIYGLRPVCEVIFHYILCGYCTGVESIHERPLPRATKAGSSRETTAAGKSSLQSANEALKLSLEAARVAANGNVCTADSTVDAAFVKLKESVSATPQPYRRQDWNIMRGWDEKGVGSV